MKIERLEYGFRVRMTDIARPDGMFWQDVREDIAHALIRRGMEAQRERDAKLIEIYQNADGSPANEIRSLIILATDIEAAIGEGE